MRTIVFLTVFALPMLCRPSAAYRSVSIDPAGQLHIVPDSGDEIQPPKLPDQVSFSNAALSPDHRTVGWLVQYPDPSIANGDPLPGKLVLYRNGRVLHTFSTEQIFWDWQFRQTGKRVASCEGPTHGGAAQCSLREVNSGRIVSKWTPNQQSTPPAWATGLRY